MKRVTRRKKKEGSPLGVIVPTVFGFILLYACVTLAHEKEGLAVLPGLLAVLFLSPLFFALKELLGKEEPSKKATKPKTDQPTPVTKSSNVSRDTNENTRLEPRSEVHYYDDQGKPCEKEHAVKAEILEFDENGKLVNSVIGHVTPTAKNQESVDDIIDKIRGGMTGDVAADRSYLNQKMEEYSHHLHSQKIIKACGLMFAETMSESELQEWEQAMKADGPLHRNKTNAKVEPKAKENMTDTKPKLILKRRNNGKLLETDKQVTVIGSDKNSDFYIDNQEVDDINAIILYKNNRWCVANDLSYKPVAVNGEKVQPGERRELKHGDVVVIANAETFDVTECCDGRGESEGEPKSQVTQKNNQNTEDKQPEAAENPANNPFSLHNVAAKMASFMANGQFSSAKMLGDTVISSVMQQKSEKIDGHTLQLTPLEWAMHAALLGHADEKPDAEDDYTSFFLAYARALQNTKIMDGNKERFMHTESGPYLGIAAELSPENADVWHLLANAASAEGDYETFLECMKRSLMFAYEKTGPCSLADAYEELGVYYATRGDNLELASALYEAVRACGGESLALPFLLEKKDASANTRDYKAILQQHRIQIGISPLVSAASQFLSDGNYAEMLDDRTKRIIKENSAPLP